MTKNSAIALAVSAVCLGSGAAVHAQYASTTTFEPNVEPTSPETRFDWNVTDPDDNWSNGIPDASKLAILSINAPMVMTGPITAYGVHSTAAADFRFDASPSTNPLVLLSTDSVTNPGSNQAVALAATGDGEFRITPNIQLGDGTLLSGTSYFTNTGGHGSIRIDGRIREAPGTTWGVTIAAVPEVDNYDIFFRSNNNSANYITNRYTFSGPLVVQEGASVRALGNVVPYGPGTPNTVVDGILKHALNGGTMIVNALDSTATTGGFHRHSRDLVAIGANDGDGHLRGTFNNNSQEVWKLGAGTQILSNDANEHSRVTVLEGTVSVTSVSDLDAPSALGNGVDADGASGLVLDSGTLQYTGTGHSTNRLFTVALRGGAIDASGSGALVFSGTGAAVSGDSSEAFGDAADTEASETVTNMYGIKGLAQHVAAGRLTVAADVGATITAGTLPVAIDEVNRTMTLPEGQTVNVPGGGQGAPRFTFTANTAIDRTLTLAGTSTAANTITPILADSAQGGKLGITKTGAGTWILNGANTYIGPTTVEGGTLQVDLPAHAPILTGAGGADVKFGKLVLEYTDTSPAPQVLAALDDSHAAAWSTGQIRSSTATTAQALGWRDDGSRVTVMYTVYGDANLSGNVSIADLNIAKLNIGGNNDVWATGDFNYDGNTSIADINTVKLRINQTVQEPTSAPAPMAAMAMAAAADQIELVVNVVTGEVRFVGNAGDPGEITSYEIGSESGSLHTAGFTSMADQGVPGWQELLVTSTYIAEDGGFSPTSVNDVGFSLGNLFSVGGTQDLYFNYGDEGFETIAGAVSYVPEPAVVGALIALGGISALRRRRAA